MLPLEKDKITLLTLDVYKVPFSCGDVFVGEMRRQVMARAHEHMRHTKKCDTDKSVRTVKINITLYWKKR